MMNNNDVSVSRPLSSAAMESAITELVPCGAYVRALFVDKQGCDLKNYELLHPVEKKIVASACAKRRAEFGDGRWCAHQAMGALNPVLNTPIVTDHRGAPQWPSGVVGSITHTEGLRLAVVVPQTVASSVGIDAEPAEPLENFPNSVIRPTEKSQLDDLYHLGVPSPERLLFCAKESIYKAWYPLTGRFMGFDAAEVALRADGTFVAYLLVRPTPVPIICGRWTITNGYIVTVATTKLFTSSS